jgi:hypothetical protein
VKRNIVEGEPGGTMPWPIWRFWRRLFERISRRRRAR